MFTTDELLTLITGLAHGIAVRLKVLAVWTDKEILTIPTTLWNEYWYWLLKQFLGIPD